MKPHPGIGELETPRDLLQKLHQDLKRLQTNRADSHAAFDFFVTAEHMVDWVLPGDVNRKQRKALRATEILLQVASHIASGSKHFVAEDPHHVSVQHVDVAYSSNAGLSTSVVGSSVSQLYVELDGPAAQAFGRTASVTDLAEQLVCYWEKYLMQP